MRSWREHGAIPRILLLVVTVFLLTACGSDSSDNTVNGKSANNESPGNLVLSSMCRAVELANNGDNEQASTVFRDDIHQDLHDLAARTSEYDRAVAADLLEAKQKVEAAIDDRASELGPPLTRLLADTRSAITATGTAPAKCE